MSDTMVMARTLRAQAADALRLLIDESYSPGERLPPEPELAKRMSLSRNTVREAIGELVAEGRLDRRWGVGTTVLAPREQAAFSVTDVGPIRQIIESSGHVPGLLRFSADVVAAPPAARHELELGADEKVLSIERLFAVDGTPAVWIQDWCRTHVDGKPVDVSPLRDINVDLPSLIREQTGRVLDRLEGRIDAVMPTAEFISGDGEPVPLVQISQTVLTRDDLPLVYSVVRFDTAVVDLTIRRAFVAR